MVVRMVILGGGSGSGSVCGSGTGWLVRMRSSRRELVVRVLGVVGAMVIGSIGGVV